MLKEIRSTEKDPQGQYLTFTWMAWSILTGWWLFTNPSETYATFKLRSSSPKVRGENMNNIWVATIIKIVTLPKKMLVNVASSRPNFLAKFIICKHQPQLVSAQLTPLCSDHLVAKWPCFAHRCRAHHYTSSFTNITPQMTMFESMIFLSQWWEMLLPWIVSTSHSSIFTQLGRELFSSTYWRLKRKKQTNSDFGFRPRYFRWLLLFENGFFRFL